jgi:hypothetical protein
MIIEISCPGCQRRYRVDSQFQGRRIRCKHCAAAITITPEDLSETPSRSSNFADTTDHLVPADGKATRHAGRLKWLWIAGAGIALLLIFGMVLVPMVTVAIRSTTADTQSRSLTAAAVKRLIKTVIGQDTTRLKPAEATLVNAQGPVVELIEKTLGDVASPTAHKRLNHVLRAIKNKYYPGAMVNLQIHNMAMQQATSKLVFATHDDWDFSGLYQLCYFANPTARTFSLDSVHGPVLKEIWRLQRLALLTAAAAHGHEQSEPAAAAVQGPPWNKQALGARCPVAFDGGFAFMLKGISFKEYQDFLKGWSSPHREMLLHMVLVIDPSMRASFSLKRAGYLTEIVDGAGHSLLPIGTTAAAHVASAPLGSGHVLSGTELPYTFDGPARLPTDGTISYIRGYLPAEIWIPQRIVITHPQSTGQRFRLRNGDTFIYHGLSGTEFHFTLVMRRTHGRTLIGSPLMVSWSLARHARITGRDASGHRLVAKPVWDHTRGQRARILEEIFRPASRPVSAATLSSFAPPPPPAMPPRRLVITLYPTARWHQLPFTFKNLATPLYAQNPAPPKPLPKQLGKQLHRGVFWTYQRRTGSCKGAVWQINMLEFRQEAQYMLRNPMKESVWAQLSARPDCKSASFDFAAMPGQLQPSHPANVGTHPSGPVLLALADDSSTLISPTGRKPMFSVDAMSPRVLSVTLSARAAPAQHDIAILRGSVPVKFLGKPVKFPPIDIAPHERWSRPIDISKDVSIRIRVMHTHFIGGPGTNRFSRLMDIDFIPRRIAGTTPAPPSLAAIKSRWLSGTVTLRDASGRSWGTAQLHPYSYPAAGGTYRGKIWHPPTLPRGDVRELIIGGAGPEIGHQPATAIFSYRKKLPTVRSVFDFRNIPWQPVSHQ